MCVGIHWSNVVAQSSILLALVCGAACGPGRGLAARYDELDRTSLVRGAACDRSDQDTTHYLHSPLYHPCAVTLAAQRIANDMRPEFSQTGRSQNCYFALVELAVDTLGRPELRTARLVRTNDPGFAAEVLALVPGLRFQPARLGGRRVRQLYQLREVLRVQRGRGFETGAPRQRGAGTRGTIMPLSPTPASEAPSGAELPSYQGPGPVC
jgi:hypothetical protein